VQGRGGGGREVGRQEGRKVNVFRQTLQHKVQAAVVRSSEPGRRRCRTRMESGKSKGRQNQGKGRTCRRAKGEAGCSRQAARGLCRAAGSAGSSYLPGRAGQQVVVRCRQEVTTYIAGDSGQ